MDEKICMEFCHGALLACCRNQTRPHGRTYKRKHNFFGILVDFRKCREYPFHNIYSITSKLSFSYHTVAFQLGMASEQVTNSAASDSKPPAGEKNQEMRAVSVGLDEVHPQTNTSVGSTAHWDRGHSILSSEGAIGRQFNPEGNIGQFGNKIGGPFHENGFIGRQFDPDKDGIGGQLERAVGGPRKDT
ncbi:hypothetical protein AA313_de0201041 [Arthrobotrys entomopaga]|nr:hypothetical protein AA313_de0201041 [Arthrobotrys entomopaga]